MPKSPLIGTMELAKCPKLKPYETRNDIYVGAVCDLPGDRSLFLFLTELGALDKPRWEWWPQVIRSTSMWHNAVRNCTCTL